MSLLAVGVSHQTAPVALLEQFAMGPDDRVKALHELVESDHVSEALVLATCNRIEVFAEVERFHGGVTDVSRVLARQAGATVEELSPYVTVHYEDQAVAHLFTVASGLDSMVVGETQVLGQLRAAYALAREEGTVGRALHPVAQRALRVGKRVHTETGIDRAGASLVSVALDRAENVIGGLRDRAVLVVGAGSMGALAATTLARRGAAVVVSSRTEASAARLAGSLGGRAAGLADLPAELAAADVLVTCTGATGLVVDTDVVVGAMADRSGRPLVVVDLALPRDVDPGVAALPGVHVVDLALLQSEKDLALLQSEKDLALLQSEKDGALLQGERAATPGRPTAGPVAADDIAAAHALVETETARTVHRVVDKLLHEPTVRVKELAATSGDTDYAGALRALFGLGIDTPVEVLADAVTVDPQLRAEEAS
jgi:glutamyl-tRNA reductase